MNLPSKPVTLSPEQVAELSKQLSDLRHDINNRLALVLAAAEIMKKRPESADRMIATLLEQPARVTETLRKFSSEFEQALGLRR